MRVFAALFAVSGFLALAMLPLPGRCAGAEGKEDAAQLCLQVAALQLLHQLDASPAQMEALAKLAKDTAKARARKPKASDKVRQALAELRDALIQGDDDKISDLTDRVDELRSADATDLDDAIDTTAAARKAAPEALRLFSARQVHAYLGNYDEDDLPDPLERMTNAMKDGRALTAADWKTLCKEVVDEVGWQIGGLDDDATRKVAAKVAALLERSRKLTDDDFKAKQADLEKAAREILGEVGPTDVLQHLAQRDLAELLSNPQLPAALEARLKKSRQ
jgi:hypothetical protein